MTDGKVALVTGGSRGIGRDIALALAGAGISVALTYRVNGALAGETVNLIERSGGRALAVPLEAGSRTSIGGALEAVRRELGPPAILVNNAAMAQEKPFAAISDSDWDRMLAVNLRGPFVLCQEVLPAMLERGWGRIVNIASIGGQWGGFNQVHYAAAKAGLISLTRSLARVYSGRGITTNAVAPGLVGSDMAARELDSPEGREKVRQIPVGRIATGSEVAAVVVFLASEAAGYVTGQTVNVNGGMYFG